MIQGNKPGVGKMIAACLLGILLALFSPLIILTELMSLLVVVLVPAIGIMLLYRWAGIGPALLSAVLQVVFTAQLLGGTFMGMCMMTIILPLLLLLRYEKFSFFTRMKVAIGGFCGGTVAAVTLMYLNYGGNMIERVLLLLPKAMRTIPMEALQMPMQTLGTALGREITAESFYGLFDEMIHSLIPYYQLNLPGLLFSGSIITAVLCVSLSSLVRVKRGMAPAGTHVPLRDWYLPASTTSGVLTMAVAGYIIHLLGMQQGQTLYTTVFSIAITVFTIQAMASFARRLHEMRLKSGLQTAILILIAVLCLLGGSLYTALYGIASAIFGRGGSMRQRMESQQNKNDHSDQT